MKIIKEGKPQTSGILSGECEKCGCIIEVDWWDHMIKRNGPTISYRCPTYGCCNQIGIAKIAKP